MGLHMMSPQGSPPLNVGVEFAAGSVFWSFNRGEAVHRARKVPRGVEDRQPSVVSGSVTLPTTRQFSLPTFVAFPGAESCVLGMGQACFPEVPTDLCAGVRLQPSRTPGGAKGHPHLGESWRGGRFSEDGAPVSPPIRGGGRSRNHAKRGRPAWLKPLHRAGAVGFGQAEAMHEEHRVSNRERAPKRRPSNAESPASPETAGFHEHSRNCVQGVGHIGAAKPRREGTVRRPQAEGDLLRRQQGRVDRHRGGVELDPMLPHGVSVLDILRCSQGAHRGHGPGRTG